MRRLRWGPAQSRRELPLLSREWVGTSDWCIGIKIERLTLQLRFQPGQWYNLEYKEEMKVWICESGNNCVEKITPARSAGHVTFRWGQWDSGGHKGLGLNFACVVSLYRPASFRQIAVWQPEQRSSAGRCHAPPFAVTDQWHRNHSERHYWENEKSVSAHRLGLESTPSHEDARLLKIAVNCVWERGIRPDQWRSCHVGIYSGWKQSIPYTAHGRVYSVPQTLGSVTPLIH